MKYLLMICGGESRTPSTPRMEIDDWVGEMDGRGVRLLGRALDAPQAAATVRVRDGETLVSDGPFAETREHVAGFDVVQCAHLDEAIEVASLHPVAAWGAVEVRPFATEFELTDTAREWGAAQPPDSWVLFPCVDGVAADDATEAAIQRDAIAFGDRLDERGILVLGRALAPAHTATTVRVDGDETLITDGPFVETREFIAGVVVVQGIDSDEAISLAAAHPLAAYHRVEARRFCD